MGIFKTPHDSRFPMPITSRPHGQLHEQLTESINSSSPRTSAIWSLPWLYPGKFFKSFNSVFYFNLLPHIPQNRDYRFPGSSRPGI